MGECDEEADDAILERVSLEVMALCGMGPRKGSTEPNRFCPVSSVMTKLKKDSGKKSCEEDGGALQASSGTLVLRSKIALRSERSTTQSSSGDG